MATETQGNAETTLQWYGHASFRICHKDMVIYIDPWKLPDEPRDATIVLVSHSHHDHYSPEDIAKVKGPKTQLMASADVIEAEGSGQSLVPGLVVAMGPVKITPVLAYNRAKKFHPRANNWLGFVLDLDGRRIYYAGDTDRIEEMKSLGNIDVALLPVGGTYTMTAEEAAEATEEILPRLAIPYHWGDIVGTGEDAQRFAELCGCEVKILDQGQSLALE